MRQRRLPPRDRGQAHVLEAVIGALLLLTSVLFALQSTAVTPLSASTSSQHIENQQQETARGLLAAGAENESLTRAMLYFNNTTTKFHGAEDLRYYTGGGPNVTLAAMLNRTFVSRGLSYNVYFSFQTPSNETTTRRFIYNGVPSDNAVSASRTTVLKDSDSLYFMNRTPNTDARLGEDATNFYMGDISPNSDVFNVVRVEVVVWRV